ncbi:MAG TPA: chemotaxis protein CheD [Gemmatimonadaceae bacterium]|jgi:chemotaxis protein CheD|nr:chemotaxis protein CheD [Gemmatimonadaceae bacterium]
MSATLTEVRVKVADYAVATGGMLSTIGLGSCVAIVLYDPESAIGGLAHVLLPNETMSRDRSNPAKFPATVVPRLLDEMRQLGAEVGRIRAKIAGGASMFGNLMGTGGMNIGERNVQAVRRALEMAGIPVVADDTGSDYGRSVFFFLDDGRVEIRSLRKGSRVL